MDKTEVMTTLKLAAVSHRAWLSNAQALIEGVPLDKDKVPVSATECEFGKWFYGDGQRLRTLPGFQEIEKPHDNLHQTYAEIFTLLYGEESKKPSLFSRLIGSAQKAAAEKREAAKVKSLILKDHSTEVVDQLEQLQRMINEMEEEQLSSYLS
ncbi:Chemoreceptor zinc-binding domain-containing protein [Candidatus Electrothrix communis]|uniref:Chemoreceptor zinc-binding domain-containing protein n=1 Tax=Candidatus Electrothrix communis TaxID=1859133 RepID=A0A444J9S2_9BACT|nr:CZB domain-containing protein [Desulfobulbus sp. US4]MCW5214276.1 CZB domain-containing protein [Desulfobulbus sp. US5]RWX49848.1 Chemoreceptor zinc-binding domain-containing protein [Candidatus Electrothrix communis]WLE98216.1 MAG: CZB domain-containing protein [Candidatus Electrothrix communis]